MLVICISGDQKTEVYSDKTLKHHEQNLSSILLIKYDKFYCLVLFIDNFSRFPTVKVKYMYKSLYAFLWIQMN